MDCESVVSLPSSSGVSPKQQSTELTSATIALYEKNEKAQGDKSCK